MSDFDKVVKDGTQELAFKQTFQVIVKPNFSLIILEKVWLKCKLKACSHFYLVKGQPRKEQMFHGTENLLSTVILLDHFFSIGAEEITPMYFSSAGTLEY